MKPEVKEKILDFLKKHTLGVMSTIHQDGRGPEAAVVGFAEQEDLKLIIGTSNVSRKYQNIKANNNVALVIGWDGKVGTLQYEGTIEEVPQAESAKYADIQIAKNPYTKKYSERPDQRYFVISPKWIRLTDFSDQEPQIDEVIF